VGRLLTLLLVLGLHKKAGIWSIIYMMGKAEAGRAGMPSTNALNSMSERIYAAGNYHLKNRALEA
jgi:hypothetical protein